MIADDLFESAASGPSDMAFFRLEREYRQMLDKQINETDNGSSVENYIITYINNTIATAKALELDFLDHWQLPDGRRNIWDDYKRFTLEVDHFTIQIRIANVRAAPKFSVALNADEKRHLRGYADAIKDLIDKSDLVTAKKDRLYDKINAFINELDRERMPLQVFHDVTTAVAATGGEAFDKLEPAWKWIRLAAEILGVRQQTEQQKLPAPPKKLEPPKPKLLQPAKPNGVGRRREMDDEIPF